MNQKKILSANSANEQRESVVETIFLKWYRFLNHSRREEDYLTMYVDAPFCHSRCSYCMHHRFKLGEKISIDSYLNFVEQEMNVFTELFKNSSFDCIYYGGGTPSILDENQLKRLLNLPLNYFNINIDRDNMFSIETSPRTLTHEKIKILSDSYINRISIGIQSFDEDVLKANNRINNGTEHVKELIIDLLENFEHVNCDIMIGINNQQDEDVIKSFDILANLKVPRISIYANRQALINDIYESEINKSFYRNRVQPVINKIIDEYPDYMESSKIATEWNGFIRRDLKHLFKKWYNTAPTYANNNIGFGELGKSWIIPERIIYQKTDNLGDYIILDQSPSRWEIFDEFNGNEKLYHEGCDYQLGS